MTDDNLDSNDLPDLNADGEEEGEVEHSELVDDKEDEPEEKGADENVEDTEEGERNGEGPAKEEENQNAAAEEKSYAKQFEDLRKQVADLMVQLQKERSSKVKNTDVTEDANSRIDKAKRAPNFGNLYLNAVKQHTTEVAGEFEESMRLATENAELDFNTTMRSLRQNLYYVQQNYWDCFDSTFRQQITRRRRV